MKWWNSFTCLQWWNHRVLINIESALNSRLFLTWSALSLTKKQPYKSGKIWSKLCFCWISKTTKTGHNNMWLLMVRALCYSHDYSNGDIRLIEPQAWKLTLYLYISVHSHVEYFFYRIPWLTLADHALHWELLLKKCQLK